MSRFNRPNWLSEKHFNLMIVGHWLMSQMKHHDDYTRDQIILLDELFGVYESPNKICDFFNSFEEEKQEFANRIANGNYSPYYGLSRTKSNKEIYQRTIVIDYEDDDNLNVNVYSKYESKSKFERLLGL